MAGQSCWWGSLGDKARAAWGRAVGSRARRLTPAGLLLSTPLSPNPDLLLQLYLEKATVGWICELIETGECQLSQHSCISFVGKCRQAGRQRSGQAGQVKRLSGRLAGKQACRCLGSKARWAAGESRGGFKGTSSQSAVLRHDAFLRLPACSLRLLAHHCKVLAGQLGTSECTGTGKAAGRGLCSWQRQCLRRTAASLRQGACWQWQQRRRQPWS